MLRLDRTNGDPRSGITVLRRVLGRPAVIAAAAVVTPRDAAAGQSAGAPVMMSVKFIDGDLLAALSGQLRLTNLRLMQNSPPPDGDFLDTVHASDGSTLARFVWTPKQPGSDIVRSVAPFIIVALAGFALLAAFVLRYMRRTAATIAAGETRLRFLAMHDPLCGLPNRIYFGERLEAAIAEVRAGGGGAAVFYIDLDHFKDVNDTLGHNIGDELIRNVTLRLSNTLRGGDLVARLGGDEFAVISQIDRRAEPRADAGAADHQGDLRALFGQRPQHRHRRLDRHRRHRQELRAAPPTSCATPTWRSTAPRTRAATAPASTTPRWTRPCPTASCWKATCARPSPRAACASPTSRSSTKAARRSWVSRLSAAGRIPCAATSRRRSSSRSPSTPAASSSSAPSCCARLASTATPGRSSALAVNVSPLQFRRADFVDQVERILKETGFDPARLELELTESVLLGNVDSAEAAMLRLKALGVRIALDDFGTGYSSLLYLRRYPFDKLKIDRSFVLSIEKAADAAAIVHAIVGLGRGLGMKVTAEGVETADQHLFLRAAGVHFMQGYRFGAAMPAADIARRLDEEAAPHPAGKPTALAS